jgi:hypothetical protein
MPKMKEKETPDLTNVSEVDLLQAMIDITMRNQQLDSHDMDDLKAINEEFKRRESLQLLPAKVGIRAYRDKQL